MKNVLGFLQRKSKTAKLLVMSMMISMLAVCSAIGASATDGTTTTNLQETFSTSLSTIQEDILAYIAIALPVGLAIFGVTIAIKKGINFVRGLIGKS